MITIISPAKTLDFTTQSQIKEYSQPQFLDKAEILIRELRKLKPKDIIKLMSVNEEIANLNFERFLSWKLPFNEKNAKQALLAFKGQVFIGLEAQSLSQDDLLFSQNHLRILSGLYGVLRPLDLIQAYRLEMGIKLKNPAGKNLYEFWGNKITENINKELLAQKNKVLINLASNEYYKVINPKMIQGNIITPVFKELKGNEFKVVTIYAKTARGYMSRFIIQNRIENPEDIKAFDTGGYLYNRDLSNNKEWVFTR
ncbi:MAG TPA: peroxide stress protein YaaA [Bacteroidales bacterium]|nr:peroxide stress protein YaaA [Bacteroidales bacterium]